MNCANKVGLAFLALGVIALAYYAYKHRPSGLGQGLRQGLMVGPTQGSDPASYFSGPGGCPPSGCVAPMITDPPPTASCSKCMCRGWDPSADAEVDALATMGGINHRSYGEHRLMNAVEAAHDPRLGLSDSELQMVMHTGAP